MLTLQSRVEELASSLTSEDRSPEGVAFRGQGLASSAMPPIAMVRRLRCRRLASSVTPFWPTELDVDDSLGGSLGSPGSACQREQVLSGRVTLSGELADFAGRGWLRSVDL